MKYGRQSCTNQIREGFYMNSKKPDIFLNNKENN